VLTLQYGTQASEYATPGTARRVPIFLQLFNLSAQWILYQQRALGECSYVLFGCSCPSTTLTLLKCVLNVAWKLSRENTKINYVCIIHVPAKLLDMSGDKCAVELIFCAVKLCTYSYNKGKIGKIADQITHEDNHWLKIQKH
jgi:hypothetical protein